MKTPTNDNLQNKTAERPIYRRTIRISEQAAIAIVGIISLSIALCVSRNAQILGLLGTLISSYYAWSRGGNSPNT